MKSLWRKYYAPVADRSDTADSNAKDAEAGEKHKRNHCPKMHRVSTKKSLTVEEELTEGLHLAVWPKTDMEQFLTLLAQYPREIDQPYGVLNDSLLHRATRHARKKMVYTLLQRHARVDAKNVNGQTALHIACQNKQEDIARMLIDAGADANAWDVQGDAPIHLACKGGSMSVLTMVMEKSICKLMCEGHLGNSLLHYAAQHGHVDIVRHLIEAGIDPDVRNYLGETPLHLAAGAHQRSTEVVNTLLSKGANLNARTAWGDTAAHYAALSGTVDVLTFLCEEGVAICKPAQQTNVAAQLCKKYGISQDIEEVMGMSLLQKVAKSACIRKGTYVLEQMMRARSISAINQSGEYLLPSTRTISYTELSEQQKSFKLMSSELHESMGKSNSALKLFLKHAPDCVEFLFDSCLMSFCGDQIQGRILFDFFMFFPPEHSDLSESETGELTLVETLITCRKERFLVHPLFETFLKLKWYRTCKFYIIILFFFGLFNVALLGYALTHFGNVLDERLSLEGRDPWWCLLVFTTAYMFLAELIMFASFLSRFTRTKSSFRETVKQKAHFLTCGLLFTKTRKLSIPIMAALIAFTDLGGETKRYICAVNVIVSCHSFMLALSRLPKIGIYIFMMDKVLTTILNFFVSYVWHFLGYAVAFHILLPKEGAFVNFGDSVIKVLTMLMGEYDFTDNFVNEGTFWLSKLIFVCFVVDMSVVLMNLVLGLAVNDVDSIQRDSNVRRMVHDCHTAMYMEELHMKMMKIPLAGKYFGRGITITSSNTCQFKEVVFLNLVDVMHDASNEIVLDRGLVGGGKIVHSCPPGVAQSIAAILSERLNQGTRSTDPATTTLLAELKEHNAALSQRVESMQEQLEQILTFIRQNRNSQSESGN